MSVARNTKCVAQGPGANSQDLLSLGWAQKMPDDALALLAELLIP